MDGDATPALLQRTLESGRLHSAYLIAGPVEAARAAALDFARGAVCEQARPCEACDGCRRSSAREEPTIDGTGKSGPLFRQIGDHPDLFWLERGPGDTRVRIGQVRALQSALRLQGGLGGPRVAVIADAEALNRESQNALLRLLEEPPPRTTLVLATASAAGLLATVRSRCQRVFLPADRSDPLDEPDAADWLTRLDQLRGAAYPELLDWAEEFRGPRAPAAASLESWLGLAGAWLRRRVGERVERGDPVRSDLEAARVLSECRRDLVQRNANPQMTAERALLALHKAQRVA